MKVRRRLPNAKPVVKKHLERTAKFKWDNILEDPRSSFNRVWSFEYMINTFWNGMLTGCKNLREVEDLSECYHERIPDTTLHDIAVQISPEPLRERIAKEVKKALRAHELPRKDFPIRLTAIDGKCVSISKKSVGDFSQKSECNDTVMYVNRVLRAMHVSNETKLLLGQREICGKTTETGEFKDFLNELLEYYGKTDLLEVISVDAGMNSKKNADFIVEKKLDYIMALKHPQTRLLNLSKDLLSECKDADEITEEKANGKLVIRMLYRCYAPECPGWDHLKEFWRINQKTIDSKGNVSIEERYFMTSINPDKLSNAEVLKAIRIHWGIENNGNWVFDTVWEEDDSPWCNRGFTFVSLLRILAYNVLARLKERRFRKKNDRERSWSGIMKLINAVILTFRNELLPNKELNAFI